MGCYSRAIRVAVNISEDLIHWTIKAFRKNILQATRFGRKKSERLIYWKFLVNVQH